MDTMVQVKTDRDKRKEYLRVYGAPDLKHYLPLIYKIKHNLISIIAMHDY